jgi:hypothetical protein
MKLEIKHLAPYLPYNVKGIFTHLPNGREFELTGIIINKDNDEYDDNIDVSGKCGVYGGETADIESFKPILRHMSDYDKFESDFDLSTDFYSSHIDNRKELALLNSGSTTYLSDMITVTEWLFKHHFDVFGLIEKGLAIDINSLPEGLK